MKRKQLGTRQRLNGNGEEKNCSRSPVRIECNFQTALMLTRMKTVENFGRPCHFPLIILS